jgi:hypothetical protein
MRTVDQAAEDVKARTKPRGINPAPEGEDTPSIPPKRLAAKTVLARLDSGMTPEEKAIRDYFARDMCRLQPEFSMKAIGDPNRAYQARYDELDRAHSARFAAMLEQGMQLFPVVIFQTSIGDRYRVILADGFHRHHAHWCLKREVIPAYVITIPEEDIEREARLYAAMCNQITTKPRSDKDKEKAIQIVCAIPECETWTDKEIADHCGVDPRMVARVRKEYRIRKRKDIPPARVKKTPTNKPAPIHAPARRGTPPNARREAGEGRRGRPARVRGIPAIPNRLRPAPQHTRFQELAPGPGRHRREACGPRGRCPGLRLAGGREGHRALRLDVRR